MKKVEYGIAVLFIGIIIGVYSLFFMDVSVNANTNGLLEELYKQNPDMMQDKFANNDLLNRRLCYLIVACTFCIAGVVSIASGEDKESKILLAHSRAQTKILSLIAAQQAAIDADQLNTVIEEIKDENPLLFAMPDSEDSELKTTKEETI